MSGTKPREPRPAKPYPDFPLFAHQTRRWAKKIRGKLHYFGPWSDWRAALHRYLDERDDLYAGRRPQRRSDEPRIDDLLTRFLNSKRLHAELGEITERTVKDYVSTCQAVRDGIGGSTAVRSVQPNDFEQLRVAWSKRLGPVALSNEIQRTRTLFKYAVDAGIIESAIRFGPNFKRPSKKTIRLARANKGPRMFEAEQIRKLLDEASIPMRAIILLGINCGFGNSDVGKLQQKHLRSRADWVVFPRPKTGIDRRCPLWPETLDALGAVRLRRRDDQSAAVADYVFVTKRGKTWFKQTSDNPISKEMTKLLKRLGFHRPGLGYYALRHTFETIAGESLDQVAVDFLMGHARDDMASVYRERISDQRLIAVTEHIRQWLFSLTAGSDENAR